MGYFRNLEQVAKFLVDRKVRVSDATGFRELLDEVRLFKNELMELIKI